MRMERILMAHFDAGCGTAVDLITGENMILAAVFCRRTVRIWLMEN